MFMPSIKFMRNLARWEPVYGRAQRGYLVALVVVFATVGVAFGVHRLMPHASLSLLFMTSVVIVSSRTGLGPSLMASVLSFLNYNFFFTPPFYTFKVADDRDLTTLFFFLLMAIITGNLAARMFREIAERRTSLQRISNLYEFGRRLSSTTRGEQVLAALADHIAQSLDRSVAVFRATTAGAPELSASSSPPQAPPDGEVMAAWAQSSSGPVVRGSWHFVNLISNQDPLGMAAIHGEALETEQLALVENLCNQAAVALDRTRLEADLEKERLVSETEQLRSTLLSSVSHDLRTPLASIIGSTTSLLEYGDSFSAADRRDLMATVVQEARRLDRHIQNLLDMTRLGHGKVTLRRDWVDFHDIVFSAVERLSDAMDGVQLEINIAPEVPLLWVHGTLIEQALVNLLDNAIRFSPEGGQISINSRLAGEQIEIELCDQGPGIPPADREKIFDMFYTAQQGDRSNRQGTGLGLAICRGMVGAHGGSVSAHEGQNGRGTRMRITLPVKPPEGIIEP